MTATLLPDPSDLHFEWLWIYDGIVPTTETWSKDIVVPASVFFVTSGLGKIRVDDAEHALPRGTAFLAAPGIRRQWFASGTRLLSAAFRVSWRDGMPLFTQGLNCVMDSSRLRSLHVATRRLYRNQHGSRQAVAHREAAALSPSDFVGWCRREAAFHVWFAEYVRTLAKQGIHASPRQRPSDKRINEIIRRLEAWPVAKAMVVEELADGLDIGSRRLEQLLARDLGLTPHSHLNRRRVEVARQLLATTSLPLKQIAHDLGLRHASHFTKWFRQHAGMPPSAYRDGGTHEAV